MFTNITPLHLKGIGRVKVSKMFITGNVNILI